MNETAPPMQIWFAIDGEICTILEQFSNDVSEISIGINIDLGICTFNTDAIPI
jgi:hypothetical protein